MVPVNKRKPTSLPTKALVWFVSLSYISFLIYISTRWAGPSCYPTSSSSSCYEVSSHNLNNGTSEESIDRPSLLSTTTTGSSSITPFEEIAHTAYRRHHIEFRKRLEKDREKLSIDVEDWKEYNKVKHFSGGLRKEDREKLFQIYGEANSVFEFGLGESTRIAAAMQVPRYTGIDSDANWVQTARDHAPSHFRFAFADIGPTEKWGYPEEPELSKNVLNYQISTLWSEPYAFDVYMVDGRWRLPCMLVAFLHAASFPAATPTTEDTISAIKNKKTLVLVHDCVKRQQYRLLDEWFYVDVPYDPDAGLKGTKLCVYERKRSTSDADLLRLWKEYKDHKD